MSEIGIVPGVPGAGGYVELGASPQGRLFSKHILTINKQFLHPKTGRPITLGEQAWQQMKANFDSKRIIQAVSFPLANDRKRAHREPSRRRRDVRRPGARGRPGDRDARRARP
jgi:hypothetical protein